jgi:predicted ArsR family transcriptional regulator
MQSKRREIIDILKRGGPATVEELSAQLDITSVTVRHHLDVLRSEGLVSEPVVRHRTHSGRPQHVFALTTKASEFFPRNYEGLAEVLLSEMRSCLDERQINVIFEGAAARLVAEAPRPQPDEPLETRAEKAVEFLNQKGYVAEWERRPEGILLHTRNCPYDGLANANPELCSLDLDLMASLMGVQLQRVCHMAKGDPSCDYLIKTSTS